jgi:mannosyltransferase OCH1-like enzyme
MIPKKIHQICIGSLKLKPEIVKNISFIKSNNPGWEHRLYFDEEAREYLKSNLGPDDCRTIQKLNPKYNVVLADLIRYFLIYNEGGVYLDLKSTARKRFDAVLKPEDSYILSQWPNRVGQQYPGVGIHPDLVRIPGGEFQQWHIVSCPRHPFLKNVIQNTLFNCANYHPNWFGVGKMGVLRLSGPICYILAIAPIRLLHSHRIDDVTNLGFQYTIYPKQSNIEFHTRSQNHYSRQVEPIFTAN